MSEFYRVDTGANGSVFVRNTSTKNYVIAHSEGTGSTSITGGNVGIGETTPAANLHIIGDTGIIIQHSNSQGNHIYTNSDGQLVFGGQNTAGTDDYVWIDDDSGDVGIGNSAPQGRLDVLGTAGELLLIDDDLSGTVFSANDVSGLPMIQACADGNVHINPFEQGHLDLGNNYTVNSKSNNTCQTKRFYCLDGVNDYIDISSTGNNLYTGDHTFTAWFNADVAEASVIMSVDDDTGWYHKTVLYTTATGSWFGNTLETLGRIN